MECSLVPGCKKEDKQECEIKDVIVTTQVHLSCRYICTRRQNSLNKLLKRIKMEHQGKRLPPKYPWWFQLEASWFCGRGRMAYPFQGSRLMLALAQLDLWSLKSLTVDREPLTLSSWRTSMWNLLLIGGVPMICTTPSHLPLRQEGGPLQWGPQAGGLPWGDGNGAGAGREAEAGDPHEAEGLQLMHTQCQLWYQQFHTVRGLKIHHEEDNCQMKTTCNEGGQDVPFPSPSPKESSTGDSSDEATGVKITSIRLGQGTVGSSWYCLSLK